MVVPSNHGWPAPLVPSVPGLSRGSRSHTNPASAGGRGVYEAKRIRSLYLPWMTGGTPKLSTTTPPKGLASLSIIDAAITPWRDAFAE
jgi:hypothetical protein